MAQMQAPIVYFDESPSIVVTFGFVLEIDAQADATGLPQFGYTLMHIFP
jgi:hypothetical protein